jgi:hypothetical protein
MRVNYSRLEREFDRWPGVGADAIESSEYRSALACQSVRTRKRYSSALSIALTEQVARRWRWGLA